MLTLRNGHLATFFPFETTLDELLGDGAVSGASWQGLVPAADVRETADGYVIEVDVPGLAQADVQVTLENKRLTLKGERKPAEGASFTRQERPFGAFERTFSLPDDVDAARIEAHARNGVLTVTLPRAEAAKPKTITVTSA